MSSLLVRFFRLIGFHSTIVLAIAVFCSPLLHADMILTAAGSSAGFTLTNFVDQIPDNGAVGPVGITFQSSGAVMISSYAAGKVDVFSSDIDGQLYSSGMLSTTSYGGNNAAGMATLGGNYYMALQATGSVVQVDASGNFLRTVVTGVPAATGLVADPLTGHLYVSTLGNNVIWNIDPVSDTKTVFVNASADGLTLSPDGSILYAEVNGHILGFDTATGLQVFDSGFINGADGAAVGFGSLAGNIFVNTNFGELVEVNITTDAQTVLGTGGSRGDLISVDPNGTLLLTQTDEVLRLTAPAGGSFSTPEPSTLMMFGSGLFGIFGALRRRLR